MNLIRYEHPSFDELDRFFNSAFWPGVGRADSLFDRFSEGLNPVDLYEDEKNYYVRAEIPGVKREEVDLNIEKNVLTIKAENKQESEGAQSHYEFTRAVSIPEGVHHDNISASLEDGLLTVTLPKDESNKAKQIQVN